MIVTLSRRFKQRNLMIAKHWSFIIMSFKYMRRDMHLLMDSKSNEIETVRGKNKSYEMKVIEQDELLNLTFAEINCSV